MAYFISGKEEVHLVCSSTEDVDSARDSQGVHADGLDDDLINDVDMRCSRDPEPMIEMKKP